MSVLHKIKRSPHVVLLDNRDSFVFNVQRYLVRLGAQVTVLRSDTTSLKSLEQASMDALVISPGPRAPEQAGISVPAIQHWAARVPVLGICLGHQAIGVAWGAPVVRAQHPMHGRASVVQHDALGIYTGLPTPTQVGRYHALALNEAQLPNMLVPTSWADDGTLMGVRHRHWPTEGVQFHPESVLSEHGTLMLERFLSWV